VTEYDNKIRILIFSANVGLLQNLHHQREFSAKEVCCPWLSSSVLTCP